MKKISIRNIISGKDKSNITIDMYKSLKLILIIITIFVTGCTQEPPPTVNKGKIVFLRFQSAAFSKEKKSEIYVISPNGENEERITKNSRMELFPNWSTDRKNIICAIDELGHSILTDKEEIISIDYKSGKETPISINSGSPNISPDDRRIVYIREGNIWIMNKNGENQKRITKFSKTCEMSKISWSSDSKTLFFSCDKGKEAKEKTGYDIYRISAKGSHLIRLTKGKEDEIEPAISPEGKSVIYSRKKSNGYELMTMDTNGKNQKLFLSVEEGGTQAAWSPDGKMIIYVRDESIYLSSLDRKYQKKLTKGFYPDWIF